MRVTLFVLFFSLNLFARSAFFDTYPVIQLGHPTLRLEAQNISIDKIQTPGFQKLLKDMFTTMRRNQGVGLAAPQINISEKIFVIGSILSGVKKRVFINPEVEFIEDPSKISNEGCLSTNGHGSHKVSRYPKVFVKYYDENAEYQEKEFSGFTAIVIQHEYDHLMGKLIVDYPQDLFIADPSQIFEAPMTL